LLASKNFPVKLRHVLVGAIALFVPLNSCHRFTDARPNQTSTLTATPKILWSGNFKANNWMQQWHIQRQGGWGWQNISVVDDRRFSKILRVAYPAGSSSPEVARRKGTPIGGGQFIANLGIPPGDKLRLSYYVRFSDNFDFVKGGKLPGLYGGIANSGGKIPNGTDGFSTRLMWRRGGEGEVYAYLPTSAEYGTSLGRGAWRFRPGVWHLIEQEITLNQPGQKNGRVQVWIDGKKVFEQGGVLFRTVPSLKINGLFFSTFFGGSDASWSTSKRVYADFADFSVSASRD
jgi:hypothetical protein